jgi:hypothetical protein
VSLISTERRGGPKEGRRTNPLVVNDGDLDDLAVPAELILEIDFSSPDGEAKDSQNFGLGRVLIE